MRSKSPTRLAVVLACGALLLTGCTPALAPVPVPAQSSTTPQVPLFASNDEALAAAREAFAAYLQMSDRILEDGGMDPERIEQSAPRDLATLEIEGFAQMQAKGWRSTGASVFSNMSIQGIDTTSADHKGIVTVYVCSDVSGVAVLGADGQSVVAMDRPDRTPFVVSFDLVAQDPPKLLVASTQVWDTRGVC